MELLVELAASAFNTIEAHVGKKEPGIIRPTVKGLIFFHGVVGLTLINRFEPCALGYPAWQKRMKLQL